MARIRSIKPESFQDEKLGPLDPIHRLVWYGLIAQADDEGRLIDNLKIIDAFIFPHSEHSSRATLDLLASMSRVIRYVGRSGQSIMQIVRWKDHQKIDRPTASRLDAPSPELIEAALVGTPREPFARHSREDREVVAPDLDQDQGSGPSTHITARERFLSWVVKRSATGRTHAAGWSEQLDAWKEGLGLQAGMRATDQDIEIALDDFLKNGVGSPDRAFIRAHVVRIIRERKSAEQREAAARPGAFTHRSGRASNAAEEAFHNAGMAVGLIPLRES
jgi:hypothetical protein